MKNRKEQRQRRHLRLRRRVCGTAARPRMAICVTNQHMYVQFVDDDEARTLASASTLGADGKCNRESAKTLGEAAARAAVDRGIGRVVVDRGGFRYHGRVREIVEAALAAGLSITESATTEEESK